MNGVPGRTQAGEFAIVAKEFNLLASCSSENLPMMNYSHKTMLKNSETRFAKRHLDFIVNSEFKTFFKKRAKLVAFLRQFLNVRDYLEVETPILNA